MQNKDCESQEYTSEIYIVLLTNVTPTNITKTIESSYRGLRS